MDCIPDSRILVGLRPGQPEHKMWLRLVEKYGYAKARLIVEEAQAEVRIRSKADVLSRSDVRRIIVVIEESRLPPGKETERLHTSNVQFHQQQEVTNHD